MCLLVSYVIRDETRYKTSRVILQETYEISLSMFKILST